MALHRNVSSVPLEGLPDGRQILVGPDVDLSEEELALEAVSKHLQQGALVPVTMAAETEARKPASKRSHQEA